MGFFDSDASTKTTAHTVTPVGQTGLNLIAGGKITVGKNASLTLRTGLSDVDRVTIADSVRGAIQGNIFPGNIPTNTEYVALGGGGSSPVVMGEDKPPENNRMLLVLGGVAALVAIYASTKGN